MVKKSIFLLCFLVLIQNIPNSYAQEVPNKWGNVVSSSGKNITIESANPADKYKPYFDFTASGNIDLNGIASISELKKGEFIIVEYWLNNRGEAIAQKITAPDRFGEGLRNDRQAGTNVNEEIRKLWREIELIKQKLGS